MPINSEYTINSFSPGFRDALLSRNLLADTVKNNSVSSWLQDINKPADIGDGVGMVKGSPDIEVEGPVYRLSNTKFNKINSKEYYTNFNIVNVSRDIFLNLGGRDPLIASPTTDGPFWRDTQNTIFNPFRIGNDQYYGNVPVKYDEVNIITNTELVDSGSNNNPEDDGVFRRELSITQNRYRSTNYERIDIQQLPWEVNSALISLNLTPNEYGPLETFLETYTENGVRLPLSVNTIGNVRDFNTTKNIYLDVAKQTRIDLRTEPQVAPGRQLTSYLDNFNSARIGGASTQIVDVLGSVLTGGGVGFDPNSGNPVPDFDVRSSLLGRGLAATGAINDTRLGQISAGYLAAAIGNNIAFNLQEETIGRINTNPLSLAMGGDIIVPNNKITVGEGGLGLAGDILERLTGAKIPVSPIPDDADIFTYTKKGYIGIGNIQRANNLLANTGKGTVQALFGNINSNINPNLIGNRNGYAPQYIDGDKTTDESIIYAFSDGNGGVIDILSPSDENSPLAQSSHNLSGVITNSGFNINPGKGSFLFIRPKDSNDRSFLTTFVWGDKRWNKLVEDLSETDNSAKFAGTKRSLLNRTQELFNSGKMRTLTGGKGIQVNQDETTTTTGPSGAFMSKGSGVQIGGGVGLNSEQAPEEIFARAWSPVDRYDQYKDLQKHSRLDKNARTDQTVDVESSVLEEHGILKIGPYPDDRINKFMFSIENLAWADYEIDLPGCEIGEGDPLTGRKGRVMWFPPYELSFNESVSTNWDRNNFIGRGEPVYTYNNTERSGNLSWKIIIDHPNYLNYMKGRSDDEIAAFFAGALDVEEIRDRILSEREKSILDVKNAEQARAVKENVDNDELPKIEFNIYFPNDVAELPDTTGYEDGLDDSGGDIDYTLNPTGEGLGNGTTVGEGIVGSKGRVYNDNTNFGLNNSTVSIIDTPSTFNWSDSGKIVNELKAMLDIEGGPYLYSRITLTGYASQQGDAEKNEVLARTRANKTKEWLVNNILLGYSDDEINKRFRINSEVITSSSCIAGVSQDSKECKEDRKVTVRIEYDASLKPQKVTQTDASEPDTTNLNIPISRYYTECSYFERVAEETENFAIQQIKDKIKNFHPAFHSITPEGFNSRLTFLHQCTRQGPTKNDDGKTPDNLAFGRAPVCILRIGDFYNTKIIIESLTIDYEPLVWDINPEGVGVQPMIANVNISFAFIGGSSLKGPINRLQNAVSFNFFANTELYDPRADRIVDGQIKTGEQVFTEEEESDKKDAPTGGNNTKVTSQEAEAEAEATTPANTGQGDTEESTEFSLENNIEIVSESFRVLDGEGSGKGVSTNIKFKLDDNGNVILPTKDYSVKLSLIQELAADANDFGSTDSLLKVCAKDLKVLSTPKETDLGSFKLNSEGITPISTDVVSTLNGSNEPTDELTPIQLISLDFFKNMTFKGKTEFLNMSNQIQGVINCNNDPTRTPNRLNNIDYGFRLKLTFEGNGEKSTFINTKPIIFTG